MSSPSPDPSFSSMARFVVFFSCSRATVMKVEMSSECTKVKATWQGHKSHLWCKWFLCILLLSISSYDHTTIHSRLASRHIYTLLPRSIIKRKLLLPLCARTYTNIQFPKWMKKNLPTLHSGWKFFKNGPTQRQWSHFFTVYWVKARNAWSVKREAKHIFQLVWHNIIIYLRWWNVSLFA